MCVYQNRNIRNRNLSVYLLWHVDTPGCIYSQISCLTDIDFHHHAYLRECYICACTHTLYAFILICINIYCAFTDTHLH